VRRFATAVLSMSLVVSVPSVARASSDDSAGERLREAVTVEGLLRHARALQRVADAHDGTRASSTKGYGASATYVEQVLSTAGYRVTEQSFSFPFYREISPAKVSQLSPSSREYQALTFDYSASGDVVGPVVPTKDVQIPPGDEPNSNDSGCEPEDFVPASPIEPQVALVQRGTCGYLQKVTNAQAAGYDAVVIFNEGQPGRQDAAHGTLFEPVSIPAVAVSFADGSSLYADTQAAPTLLRVVTDTEVDPNASTTNIIADWTGQDPSDVVVAGAHLDSVTAGPGINDNGSGVAALLEVATEIAELRIVPRQTVRFIFWGAEEFGSLGSNHYIEQLSPAELASISAYLNFDMLGSRNYARFVYDGDGSQFGTPGPPGSDQIERIFNAYFAGQNLAVSPTQFDFRSDYTAFFDAGVPVGGLFSGAEGIKTTEEAKLYGGVANEPYDACYHQACDNLGNLSTTVLSELADGVATAILELASRDVAGGPRRPLSSPVKALRGKLS
jgi:Zn-dependent M28 family amino/carboxypeptidase